MNIVAIILARGGSKGVPKKNIIDFMGKPMIAWTIEAAVKSKIFDKIIVKYGLKQYKASEIASWWHSDADLGRQVETFADMGKSRKAGFREVQVTPDSFFDLFEQLRAEKIIPPRS